MSINGKRPVPDGVTAFKLTIDRFQRSDEWPEWLKDAWSTARGDPNRFAKPQGSFWVVKRTERFYVQTEFGTAYGKVGDYIIRCPLRGLYICRCNAYEAHHEVSDEV